MYVVYIIYFIYACMYIVKLQEHMNNTIMTIMRANILSSFRQNIRNIDSCSVMLLLYDAGENTSYYINIKR